MSSNLSFDLHRRTRLSRLFVSRSRAAQYVSRRALARSCVGVLARALDVVNLSFDLRRTRSSRLFVSRLRAAQYVSRRALARSRVGVFARALDVAKSEL